MSFELQNSEKEKKSHQTLKMVFCGRTELSANSGKINYFSLINLFIYLTPYTEKPINNVKHALPPGTGGL